MLLELSIDNFAIIDHLRVHFVSGFTVLTGETGAGKSIIIDALQAALGARVGSDVIRSDARLASVEALFEWPERGQEEQLSAILGEAGIEDEGCLILRREIHATGRSTARINGRAVPLSLLTSIGNLLVDIHGQSDHLSILRRDRQLVVLDAYGHLSPLRARVAEVIEEYTCLQRALQTLASGQREAEQRLDLLRFQAQEIESAHLQVDEEDDLQVERNLLVNAERLTQLSSDAYEALQGEANAALDGLITAVSSLQTLAAIDTALAPLLERLTSTLYEVQDIAQELRQYRDAVEYDPQRLDSIEERLELLTRLKRKYGPSLADVIAFGERVRAEMEDVENLDERLATLAQRVAEAEAHAGALAEELSHARQAVSSALAAAMREALQGLGLRSAQFDVELTQRPSDDGLPLPGGERYAYGQTGVDAVSFAVSFNPGEPLRPLDKVASGGETSRFLLALKSVLAEADRTPTLVFDEVDVGVGARAGMAVGQRMRDLAHGRQVISITHLPQIAALADEHLSVVKATAEGGRTGVSVQTLDAPARIVELAEMMSGSGTEVARQSARELLEAAGRM